MTAKEYLTQLSDIQEQIYNIEESIRQLMSRATSLTATDYSKDVVNTSGKPYAEFEVLIDSIAESQKKLIRKKIMLTYLEDEIIEKVNKIKNSSERSVIYKRYVLMKSWADIAEEMHYSVRHVTRLHGEALQSFSKQYGFPRNDVLECPIEPC